METRSGAVLRGVIVSETETVIRLNENPLASCEPKLIQKQEIEELSRSKLSPMPEQLLNTLIDPEDILDLVSPFDLGAAHPTDASFQP